MDDSLEELDGLEEVLLVEEEAEVHFARASRRSCSENAFASKAPRIFLAYARAMV